METRIAPAAALVLILTADTDKHVAREQAVTHTISVTNTGDTTAVNVELVVTIPGIAYPDDFSGFNHSFGGTFNQFIGQIAPGETVTRTYVVGVYGDISTGEKTLTTVANVNFGQPDTGAPEGGISDTDTRKSLTLDLYQGIYVLSSGVAKKRDFGPSDLRVFDIATGEEVLSFRAYPDVEGKVIRDSFRVAVGDFNGDGFDDVVVSTAHGTGPIKIFNGETGETITEIIPFNGKKGLFVAAGDVTGDGRDDIVVGSALGGGALTAIDGTNYEYIGTPIFPFGKKYKGAVRVGVADFDGVEGLPGRFNNRADEIVAAQGNFGRQMKIYSLNDIDYVERGTLTVGGARYRGGINVAVGDLDGDGQPEIAAGRNRLSAPIVDVFSIGLIDGGGVLPGSKIPSVAGGSQENSTIIKLGDMGGDLAQSFSAFPSRFRQGVRVAIGDVDGDGNADILATIGYSGGSKAQLFTGSMEEGFFKNVESELTVFDRPLPALWSAITSPVPTVFNLRG